MNYSYVDSNRLPQSSVDQGDMLERVPAIMHVLNSCGMIELVSDAWLDELGYKRDEVIGRQIEEFLTDDCRAALPASCFKAVFDIGYARGVRREFFRKNGGILRTELSANTIRSRHDNPCRWLA